MNFWRICSFKFIIFCFVFIDQGDGQLSEWIFGEQNKKSDAKPWKLAKKIRKKEKQRMKRAGRKDPDYYKSLKLEL